MQTQSWGHVPDRSMMNIQVTSSDENFTVLGMIEMNPPRPLSHAELVNGISVPVRSPGILTVQVNAFFNGGDSTTVTLTGGVSDPGGNPFGSPLDLSASGINGDHENFFVSALPAV